MEYDPDRLKLPKHRVLFHFDTAISRLSKNKRDNAAAITAIVSFKALVKYTVAERKLPYYWAELVRIFDAVRTENALYGDDTVKELSTIQNEKAVEAIKEITAEKPKVLVDFTKNLRFGGMNDG